MDTGLWMWLREGFCKAGTGSFNAYIAITYNFHMVVVEGNLTFEHLHYQRMGKVWTNYMEYKSFVLYCIVFVYCNFVFCMNTLNLIH